MTVFYYIGIGLLAFAFFAAAAESAVRLIFHMKGYFVSGQELWSALSPKTLIFSRHAVDDLLPGIWDLVILSLLAPPAWLVSGMLGIIFVFLFRPHHKKNSDPIDEESFYLIDNLVKDARLEGHDDEMGDIGSSFNDGKIYEETTYAEPDFGHDSRAQEEYIKEWDPNDSFSDNLDPENPLIDQSTHIETTRPTSLDKK